MPMRTHKYRTITTNRAHSSHARALTTNRIDSAQAADSKGAPASSPMRHAGRVDSRGRDRHLLSSEAGKHGALLEHGFASVTMLSAFSHSYLDGSKLVARLVR